MRDVSNGCFLPQGSQTRKKASSVLERGGGRDSACGPARGPPEEPGSAFPRGLSPGRLMPGVGKETEEAENANRETSDKETLGKELYVSRGAGGVHQVGCGQRGGRAFAVTTSPAIRCERFTPTASPYTASTQDQETSALLRDTNTAVQTWETLPIKARQQGLPTPPDVTRQPSL